jgi:small subunit ribosomal protein S13e
MKIDPKNTESMLTFIQYMLIKKAVAVRKHLERNRKDRDAKFRLILIESRIHRLARYYKTVGVLPPTWKYESATASTIVS